MMSMTIEEQFPQGTPVCIKQTIEMGGKNLETKVVGSVQAWEELPTGSWHAHGKKDKLWLKRLKLRKADGEITLLIIDDATEIAKLEVA